uniref:Ku70/Ku80 N-terminal alpha/beta domain-containing protein n=1 Tax=Romanomermis culicivorax TaxID=13658 RepID=A0A915HJ18_ROMCU
MDPHRWNFVDEDVEEEFLVETFYWEKFGRDSIICVIDCSEPMFMVKSEDGFTHFELALKVVLSLYNRKCLTNERDYLGILFYNTKHIKNTHNFESIYVFQELGMPGAERVKEIEKLINSE